MRQTRAKLLIVLLLGSVFANGQEFRYSARLDSIANSGFYTIHLSSEILSYLRKDLADLRIQDQTKRFVPYLIQTETSTLLTASFIDFPILSNRTIDSGKTEIILDNDSSKLIANIKLFIKNAAVSRHGSLSGSNDRQKWFIIDDQVLIGRSYESVKDEYLQEINFPGSSYRFYKLVIDNQKNDPMNILRAGGYTTLYDKRVMQLEDNPSPTIQSMDSGKYTIITIQYKQPYHISNIWLNPNGTKFYKREFQLYNIDSLTKAREYIGDFSLNSKTPLKFEFPLVKTRSLQLIIDNKDNPPLNIDEVSTQHLLITATAYFDKNNSYFLYMDNPTATFPDYDLVHFKDSIPQSIGYLNPQVIIPNPSIAAASENRKWWIWPVLIGVIAIMGFLTYKLSGDVKFNVKA